MNDFIHLSKEKYYKIERSIHQAVKHDDIDGYQFSVWRRNKDRNMDEICFSRPEDGTSPYQTLIFRLRSQTHALLVILTNGRSVAFDRFADQDDLETHRMPMRKIRDVHQLVRWALFEARMRKK